MGAESQQWFEVSRQGLRELQAGKPKHHIARELISNAFDEAAKEVRFSASWDRGMATIEVEDDSPEGFRDLKDAFTLFAPTYKRAEPEKRGRFNIGEKQVLAVCEHASISTTKGSLLFGKKGRASSTARREVGSQVTVFVKMTKAEFEEILAAVKNYLVPEGIEFFVNGEKVLRRDPYKVIEASLPTEVQEGNVLKRTQRKTKIHILKTDGKAKLHEMGIPVTEIDCQFDVDIQQKVPLSVDRETVAQSYVSAVFAEVLNVTFGALESERSSDVWIREATSNKRISTEAVRTVIERRYGDKVVVANPLDRNSIDDAIASGYRVVYGQEMSRQEWGNIRRAETMPSSTELFGSGTAASEPVEESEGMRKMAELTKKIASRCLEIDVQVRFAKWDGVAAQFGEKVLTFNVKVLGNGFFTPPVSERTLDLIVHELGHHAGHHTEKGYHEAITRMAGELTMIALRDPRFFEI